MTQQTTKALPILAQAASLSAGSAMADSLSNIGSLSNGEFRDLSAAVGAIVSYKPILPSEPQGLTGFDFGMAITSTSASLRGAVALDKAGASLHLETAVQTYRLHIHKGLPLGFDVGAFKANVPGLGLEAEGFEGRYALLSGDFAAPTVSLRGTYTRVTDSKYLSLNTRGLDLSISKGFAMLTPYAGIGQIWVDSDGRGAASGKSASPELTKYYAGINMGLGLVNLAFETDRTGSSTTWGLKMGVRW